MKGLDEPGADADGSRLNAGEGGDDEDDDRCTHFG